ncbi:MAG: NHL repeat-containing protein [Pseudomonadota bacterium]
MSELTVPDSIEHVCYYGELALPGSTASGKLPPDFTMNSPVGVHKDNYDNVWVCDTGNSRVLVFTPDLDTLLHVIEGPGQGTPDAPRLLMPFHLCPHPSEDLMYCTDMGNGRVVVFSYDKHSVSFRFTFGGADDGINTTAPSGGKKGKTSVAFTPLSDPNGITIVRESNGQDFIYVCDEFFHTKDDQRSRCVKFTLEGAYVAQFRGIVDPTDKHDLMWPQGIASDSLGNLYIANTGNYEILKINTAWPIEDGCVISPRETALLHSFGSPAGIGKFNVMRSVCVIDDHVFVPGQVENAISIYSPEGKLHSVVAGLLPLWNHSPQAAHSMSDLVYGALEDSVFVGPYQVCAAREANTYYITEPFASTVLKVKIPPATGGISEDAVLLDSVGHRRDNKDRRKATSQFNCMTSVIGIDPDRRGVARRKTDDAPAQAFDWMNGWASAAAGVYQFWYDRFRASSGFNPLANVGTSSFNIDSGNWCLKTYNTSSDPYHQLVDQVRGFFIPGDLAMAVYYPPKPLLGQICPGTPLIFITNFNACTVTMYQFGPGGHLLNYGLPFGREGMGGDGTLKAPQGIAVNSHGEIFIADSLNNRISKWQIQPTGLVTFSKNFRWEEGGKELASFSPCDVAVDSQDRLFVCDQFNDCLRAFDSEGRSLWSYGQPGYCDDMATDYSNFFLPASLCIDDEDNLIVNDLVNRAFKIFKIEEDGLKFVSGKVFFKEYPEEGGVWMPYFIYARNRRLYVPDSTFNVVNVFDY